jgi:hypothetical protein
LTAKKAPTARTLISIGLVAEKRVRTEKAKNYVAYI